MTIDCSFQKVLLNLNKYISWPYYSMHFVIIILVVLFTLDKSCTLLSNIIIEDFHRITSHATHRILTMVSMLRGICSDTKSET